jgi:hypothetical protein
MDETIKSVSKRKKTADEKNAHPRRTTKKDSFAEHPIAAHIHTLQRSAGNAAVQNMIRTRALQTKLKISSPDDEYEKEADAVADAVMRMPDPPSAVVQNTVSIALSDYGSDCVDSHQEEGVPLQRNLDPLIQTKLAIGQPNDKYEQEADRVADQVVDIPDPALQCQLENEEEKETFQTKSLADQTTPLLQKQEEPPEKEEEEFSKAEEKSGHTLQSNPTFESRINSLKSGGQPLDTSIRAFFEPRFGYDFSAVRVHTDNNASDTAKSINARAFTLGNYVIMGSDEYHPNSRAGRQLLGHELTHIIQQGEDLKSNKPQHRITVKPGYYIETGNGFKSNVITRKPNNTPTDSGGTDTIETKLENILNHIRNEAKKRALAPPSIDPNSQFCKVLKEKYLQTYLTKPSKYEGKRAIDKIGRPMEVEKRKGRIEVKPEGGKWRPAVGGEKGWEASAFRFWKTVNMPKLPEEISWLPLFKNLKKLPSEYHGATDILIKENIEILPYLDVPFLVGEPKDASKNIEADFIKGGKNMSQLMHWATGVKQAGILPEALRELFLLYETIYMEAWDVFGQDPINDLIAEEQGRLLGIELLKGDEGLIKSEAELAIFLNHSFLEARAWVGSLLKLRESELDKHILSKKPIGTLKYRQKGIKRKQIWETTIYQLLLSGLSVDKVKKHSLVNAQIEIYTLIYEAEQWIKKYGEIKLSPLQKRLAEGSLNRTMDLFAKQVRKEEITTKDQTDAMKELLGI